MSANSLAHPAVAESAEAARPFNRLTSIFGGSVGNLIEWYDWLSYSAFSLLFRQSVGFIGMSRAAF
jgi:MHS family alpha-ketoglutarate permease-like MFS transporter